MNLKTLLVTGLIIVSACSSSHKHPETKAEMTQALKKQEAETLVRNMLKAVEKRDWKEFEKSFASKAIIYRREPLLLKPNEITREIKPVQKYFDANQTELTDFKLEEKDDRVLGTGKVTSTLWKHRGITSDTVTSKAKVSFEFIRENGELKIMRMNTMDAKNKGDKKLMTKAWGKQNDPINYDAEMVEFPSKNGKKMRGWLYRPVQKIEDVVIINGNVGSIKEQGPMQYAQLLAGRGIAVLVFDFVNFGESDGKIRNLEDPSQKIDDFWGAVDYIANQDIFAGKRISLAGLGASAAYIAAEAANDNRVDRVLMIAPFLHSRLVNKQDFQASRKLTAAREANQQFLQDGVLTYVPVAGYADSNAVITSGKSSDIDYYINPERGNIPQWQNRFATMGWNEWINFNASKYAARIRVPTLVIHSPKGPFVEGVDNFISRMRNKPDIHVINSAAYDFYDHPGTMKQVVDIIENFLAPASTGTEVSSL